MDGGPGTIGSGVLLQRMPMHRSRPPPRHIFRRELVEFDVEAVEPAPADS